MAQLYFKVSSDWEEVVRLRNECEKLESQLLKMDKSKAPAAVAALEHQLGSARQKMSDMVDEAARAGATMENDFKKKIFSASQGVNDFTQKIIDQKRSIKDIEQDIRNLSAQYRKYQGTSRGDMALADYNAAKIALQEEKNALFDLTQQQAEARLEVKRLKDEFSLYKDEISEVADENDGLGISLTKIFAIIGGAKIGESLISNIVRVRGEFQLMDENIRTLLGSKEKADALLAKVKEFAAISPLELKDVNSATQMMLGFNIEAEKVPRFLQAIGDISMGEAEKFNSLTLAFSQMSSTGKLMGQDLNQMINAGFNPLMIMSEKTGKSIAALKKEMSAGAISAEMVQQAFIDATEAGGKFYNMSENAAKTINGQLSMMNDAIDSVYNEIGTKGEGVIMGAIQGATSLVKNYETIGKVLVGLVATYGAYRAAVMAVTAVERIRYQATLAQMAGMTKMQAITDILRAKTAALNKTMLANPYVLLATAVVALSAAMWTLGDSMTAAEKAKKRLNDANKDFEVSTNSEISALKIMIDRLNKAKEGTEEYSAAKKAIDDKYGSYLQNMSEEVRLLKDTTTAQKLLTEAILTTGRARNYDKMISDASGEASQKQADALTKIRDVIIKEKGKDVGEVLFAQIRSYMSEYDKEGQDYNAIYPKIVSYLNEHGLSAKELGGHKLTNQIAEYGEAAHSLRRAAEDAKSLFGEQRKESGESTEQEFDNIIEKVKEATETISTLKKELADLRSGKTQVEKGDLVKAIEDKAKELKAAEDKLTTLTGVSTKDSAKTNEKQIKEEEKIFEKRLEALRKLDDEDRKRQIENLKFKQEMEQKAIDLMNDSFEKRERQIKLNFKKEQTAIEEEQDRLLKEQSEYLKSLFVSKKGTEKGFETYFAALKKANFKDAKGIDLLPEDLRPEGIAFRISKILDAAQNEYDKANKDNIERERQSWNEYYKAYGDYQQKKLAITQLYAEKIAKANTAGEKAALKKEQEKEIANLFTTLPDYNSFFTSIYSLTKSKAIEIGNLIKKNLKDQLDKGVISANEYYESIKKINEELEKSAKGIDYFGKMQSGGIEGLLDAIKDRSYSDFGKATQDLTQANTDFGKSFTDWSKAFQAGDASAASIAQNSMVSATNMQGAAQGAMQGAQGMQQFAGAAQGAVQMVDMIVTAIDQSVRATQRIVDVFADLAEQRGIDTDKGTWGEVKETMSVISKINEKGKQSWDSLKSGDAMGSLASAVEMVAIAFKSVNGEHREALKLLKRQEDQQKHLYEIEKLRTSLEKHGETVFGSDAWGKASNAASVYQKSVENLNKSLDKLQDVDVVTGSKKSGWGPFKKRKDVWTDLLKAYPELIDANGKFDKSLAETILSTRKLTDEGKEFLQQAINNAELVEDAFAQMSDYLSGIFGDLGKTMLSAFVEAFKGSKNAMADFVDNASDMLSKLAEDFIYSIRLAPLIEKASQEAEKVMSDNLLSDEEKNKKLMDISGSLINDIMHQQGNIFADLSYWGNAIAEATGGKNPFDKESAKNQEATRKGFETMSQDTASELNGRFTALQMAGEEIKQQNIKQTEYLSSLCDIVGRFDLSNYTSTSNISNLSEEAKALMSESFARQADQANMANAVLIAEVSNLKGGVFNLGNIVDEMRTLQIEGNMRRDDIAENTTTMAKNTPKVLAIAGEIKRGLEKL